MPAKGTTKKITELRTEGDEQQYIVEAHAKMAKDDENFARLREYLTRKPKRWWQRLWGGGPAGGGR